jgi:hypothetical protein
MTLIGRALGILVLVGIVGGCTRYEMVPDYATAACQTWFRTTFTTRVTRFPTDSATPHLQGVVESQEGRPLYSAEVTLTGAVTVKSRSDERGQFRFDSIPAGQYGIRVRAVGRHAVHDTIVLPLPRNEQLRVPMLEAFHDGPCSGMFEVQVRKPWWNWW